MKFYIHFGQETVVDHSPRSTNYTLSIGPFDTLDEAMEWLSKQKSTQPPPRHAPRTQESPQPPPRSISDIRVRSR